MVSTRNRKTPELLPLSEDRPIIMQELEYRTDALGEYYEDQYQMIVLEEQEMTKEVFDNTVVCDDILEEHNYGKNESNKKCKPYRVKREYVTMSSIGLR